MLCSCGASLVRSIRLMHQVRKPAVEMLADAYRREHPAKSGYFSYSQDRLAALVEKAEERLARMKAALLTVSA